MSSGVRDTYLNEKHRLASFISHYSRNFRQPNISNSFSFVWASLEILYRIDINALLRLLYSDIKASTASANADILIIILVKWQKITCFALPILRSQNKILAGSESLSNIPIRCKKKEIWSELDEIGLSSSGARSQVQLV